MGDVAHLYDRLFWHSMQDAWQSGLAARMGTAVAAEQRTADEWRASAKRLARKLGTKVRTHWCEGIGTAVANEGFPLGIIDPEERHQYRQHQADEADARG